MLYVWPGFVCRIKGDMLVCHGVVRPNPVAGLYKVRLEHSVWGTPKVWVEHPPLVPRDGKPIPHVYRDDGKPRPCLYYPGHREWRSDMSVASTVMAWLLVWLTAYEVWQATGEWCGGGIEHGEADAPKSDVA